MPLIRAFGRWLRQKSTDNPSAGGQLIVEAPVTAMARSWVVLLIAVLAVVPIVVTGSAYEGVRALDRPNLLGERGRWVAAIAIAALAGIVLVVILT